MTHMALELGRFLTYGDEYVWIRIRTRRMADVHLHVIVAGLVVGFVAAWSRCQLAVLLVIAKGATGTVDVIRAIGVTTRVAVGAGLARGGAGLPWV